MFADIIFITVFLGVLVLNDQTITVEGAIETIEENAKSSGLA